MNKNADLSQLQSALVLHTRSYGNTSLLVDLFCENSGLVRCVAKGHKAKKNASLLSQFCLCKVALSGKSELKTLIKLESEGDRFLLREKALFCGLYVNELLLRVLYPFDPHPELFARTNLLFGELAGQTGQTELEESLRKYEFSLLKELGYLVDLQHDCLSGSKIEAEKEYYFYPEQGFSEQVPDSYAGEASAFSGYTLEKVQQGKFFFSNGEELFRKECKILTRLMLASHLGEKPLRSRALFEKK